MNLVNSWVLWRRFKFSYFEILVATMYSNELMLLQVCDLDLSISPAHSLVNVSKPWLDDALCCVWVNEWVCVLCPTAANVMWRWGHGSESHLIEWRSCGPTRVPLLQGGSGLFTTPQRLQCTIWSGPVLFSFLYHISQNKIIINRIDASYQGSAHKFS